MKIKSHRMDLLWQYIIFLGLITTVKLEDCKKTEHCEVATHAGNEICRFLCEKDQIEVKLFPNQVIISCSDTYKDSNYLKLIGNLNDDGKADKIEEFEILNCPVLNASYIDIFTAFKIKPTKKFTLSITHYDESGPLPLKPDHFANLNSTTDLRILNSDIPNLSELLFKNKTNLEHLYLCNNKLKKLPGKIFDPLKNLTYLDLSDNTLTNLDENIFQFLSNLKVLKMNNNKLNNLPNILFNTLKNLIYLDLSNSALASLNENIFQSLSNLTILKMNNNKLDNLPSKLFNTLKNLTDLEMKQNTITTLNDGIFNKLENLITLSLSDNKLTAVPAKVFANLKSLKSLNLTKSELTSLPTGLFNDTTGLQELYLNINHLNSSLDAFQTLTNLSVLDLSFNNFEKLMMQDFNFSTSRNRTINLSNNRIKKIDLNLTEIHSYEIKSTEAVVKFIIDGNPLDCDCEALHLAQYLRNDSKKSIQISPNNVSCHTPTSLQKKSLKDVKLEELKCSIEVNCPRSTKQNCSCDYRSVDNTVEVNCTSAGISALPQQLPVYNKSNIPDASTYYELFIDHNNISSVDQLKSLSEQFNIAELHLSYNHLKNINDTNISSLKALRVLELDHNDLTYLNEQTINAMKSIENLTSISLHENPWVCNCDTKYLLEFLQDHRNINISNSKNITCVKDRNRIIENLTEDDLCPVEPPKTSSSKSTLIILLLLGAFAILCYMYRQEIRVWILRNPHLRWLFTKTRGGRDGPYDAFFDHSQENLNFGGSRRENEPLVEL